MNDNVLLDTNLWVYLYAEAPDSQYFQVQQLVDQHFDQIVCSTQITGELYHVLTRKHLLSEQRAREVIDETLTVFPIFAIVSASVQEAISIHEQYGYSYWDSLILATAVLHDISLVYSEDMQHGQEIKGKVRIVNPFV